MIFGIHYLVGKIPYASSQMQDLSYVASVLTNEITGTADRAKPTGLPNSLTKSCNLANIDENKHDYA